MDRAASQSSKRPSPSNAADFRNAFEISEHWPLRTNAPLSHKFIRFMINKNLGQLDNCGQYVTTRSSKKMTSIRIPLINSPHENKAYDIIMTLAMPAKCTTIQSFKWRSRPSDAIKNSMAFDGRTDKCTTRCTKISMTSLPSATRFDYVCGFDITSNANDFLAARKTIQAMNSENFTTPVKHYDSNTRKPLTSFEMPAFFLSRDLFQVASPLPFVQLLCPHDRFIHRAAPLPISPVQGPPADIFIVLPLEVHLIALPGRHLEPLLLLL